MRARQANDLRGWIGGRREGRDGVAEAFGAFESSFDPGVACFARVGRGPVEDAGVGADGEDAVAVCGGEGAQEETLCYDCVAGRVSRCYCCCWR